MLANNTEKNIRSPYELRLNPDDQKPNQVSTFFGRNCVKLTMKAF